MENKKDKVTAAYCTLNKLTVTDISSMHVLIEQYYHNVEFDIFFKDLVKKDGVFLLRENKSGEIVGFSTFLKIPFECNGHKVNGVFSGDTIVDQRYWGNRALMACFIKKLLKLKLEDMHTPLYWLLISKGYKTYLMLSNNFPKHYPHYQKSSSSMMSSVIDQYCKSLYPEAFDRNTKLLNFGDGYQKLKDNVAPINDELKVKNPKIRFFEEKNPTWRQGTELPCVGKVTSSMFITFYKKVIKESLAN